MFIKRIKNLLIFSIVCLLLSCRPTQEIITTINTSTYTPTPLLTPTPEPVIEMGDVIFDGSECIYTGPSELSPEMYSLVMRNMTEYDMHLFVDKLSDGKTYQDVINLQSEPGDYFLEQDWFAAVSEPEIAWINPDGGEVHTYLLNHEGAYFIGLWSWETSTTPLSIWLCAPFWVK